MSRLKETYTTRCENLCPPTRSSSNAYFYHRKALKRQVHEERRIANSAVRRYKQLWKQTGDGQFSQAIERAETTVRLAMTNLKSVKESQWGHQSPLNQTHMQTLAQKLTAATPYVLGSSSTSSLSSWTSSSSGWSWPSSSSRIPQNSKAPRGPRPPTNPGSLSKSQSGSALPPDPASPSLSSRLGEKRPVDPQVKRFASGIGPKFEWEFPP